MTGTTCNSRSAGGCVAMKRVSTVELIRNFGAHSDAALSTPIIVTKNGRDRLVLISIEQYDMLQHAYDAYEDSRSHAPQERAKPARANTTGRRKG